MEPVARTYSETEEQGALGAKSYEWRINTGTERLKNAKTFMLLPPSYW
jgi:hypothetical protein